MTAKRRKQNSRKSERRLRVRSIRRDPPDIRKLSKALIALAMAEAEREAEAEQAARSSGRGGASNAPEKTGGDLDE